MSRNVTTKKNGGKALSMKEQAVSDIKRKKKRKYIIQMDVFTYTVNLLQ